MALAAGKNSLQFQAQDQAGHLSTLSAAYTIYFDDRRRVRVVPTLSSGDSGTELKVEWAAYDELANGGDLRSYLVLLSDRSFNSVSGATQKQEVKAG